MAKSIVPAPRDIGREALIVIAGAVLAAFIIGRMPGVREWIKEQWGDTPKPF